MLLSLTVHPDQCGGVDVAKRAVINCDEWRHADFFQVLRLACGLECVSNSWLSCDSYAVFYTAGLRKNVDQQDVA